MIRKISCIIVALICVVTMSISAFAINIAPTPPSYFDMAYSIKDIDKMLGTGCGEFARAYKNNDYTNFLVTAKYYYNEYSNKGYWEDIFIYYFPNGDVDFSNLSFYKHGRYLAFGFDFVPSSNSCQFLQFDIKYCSIYGQQGTSLSTCHYILTNFSDEKIVHKIKKLDDNNASYNIFDTNCKTLKFKDVFIDGVIAKLPPPPPTPSYDGGINNDCFNGFVDNVVYNLNLSVILPMVIFIFGFLLCVSIAIKFLKRFSRG